VTAAGGVRLDRGRSWRRSRGRHLHFFDGLLGGIDGFGSGFLDLLGGCLDVRLHGFALLLASGTHSLGISLDLLHRASIFFEVSSVVVSLEQLAKDRIKPPGLQIW